MKNKEMKYKALPNAKVLMSTDGTKQLFIKVGSDVVPAGLPRISIRVPTGLEFGMTVLTDEEAVQVENLVVSETPVIVRFILAEDFILTTTLAHIMDPLGGGAYYGTFWMGTAFNVILTLGDTEATAGKWTLLFLPETMPEEASTEEA